jgi:filamentous hemagglutinin
MERIDWPATTARDIDQVAGIYITGDGNGGSTLVLNAGRDVKLAAAQIGNADAKGTTTIAAGRNLDLTAVRTASSDSVAWGGKD